MSDGGFLLRSRQELAAARLLLDASFVAQAVSRSYYGAFYAAEGQADYSTEAVPAEEGEQAIEDAGAVVDAVESWLAERSGP